MEQNYIKVQAIYRKLKEAENSDRTIYLSGAVGFGKTAAVSYFYRRKPHFVLSGAQGYLPDMPKPSDITPQIVVIDDISWITEQQSRDYIKNLVANTDKHVVLIGRSAVPSWLRIMSVQENFLLADERDLMFTRQEAESFLADKKIKLPPEQLLSLVSDAKGHALSIVFAAYHMAGGEPYSSKIIEAVKLDNFHYYDSAFYEKWDEPMRQVLLALCQYETFTIEMAETITGNDQIPILLEKAMEVGSFLVKLDEENYAYRNQLRAYFNWKQSMVYTPKEKQKNFERAALYYELHNKIEEALDCYKKAGAEEEISRLLIRNAKKHPGTAHFFETREYYYALPEETVLKSPVLMSGLCILYSLTLQTEKSEAWYEKLVAYEQNAERGSAEQKEAKVRIAYLNIAMAHRGIHGMVKILKNVAVMMTSKNIHLPEFSVTSNLPSIMNGGLDFCDWSRNDRELAVLMKYPVELVLGSYAVGLVNIALAESGYEKGTMSAYEVMTRLNTGYMKSDTGGKIEMCFAATGLMIREHLANGQMTIGENLLSSFREKAWREHAEQLLPSIATCHVWLALLKGNTNEAKEWLTDAPDENQAFCILDRYHYINKVRVYIALERYEEACSLIERLNVYFTQYERHHLWMENQILKAIIQYRKGNRLWQDTLTAVLKKAEYYHFTRIFAEEGAAIKPLLDRLKEPSVKKEYFEQLKAEAGQMAAWYPKYLSGESVLKEPLTESENRILKLLCSGASTAEICEVCGCTNSNLKFHNRNIYRKLGVGNRADAERQAARLGLYP